MDVPLAIVLNGLMIGGIYALLTTGFNLVVLVSGMFHFAYPHVVVLSMYAFWMILEATGNNLVLSIPAGIAATIGIVLLTEPLFRPLAKRGAAVTSFILSLGIMIIITDVLQRQLHRGVPIAFPPSLVGKEALFRFGMATITMGHILTIVGSVLAVVAFLYLLYRVKIGRGFRAMAQNPSVARLLGIPTTRMSIYSYAIAGVLGGMSTVFLAMALGAASAPLATTLAVKVLAVALFAGLGNLRGGLWGGIILGLVESVASCYLPGDWTNAISFSIVLAVVMWRPQGLFGLRI